MRYNYESLDDARFQQLCQALLASKFPNVQCLPTDQPDGGRDAFLVNENPTNTSGMTVFQVKFSRDPNSKTEREVVIELIRTESKKVEQLIKRGATAYYFLTNVRGTSHLDAGSIDRINQELSTAFHIPVYCWWRDDIDSRLDSNSEVKWSYPEIIRGTDFLQMLYNGLLGSDEQRRLGVVNAYLTHQYRYDDRLKFRQVNLEKGLMDLFVDVPVAAIAPTHPKEREKWIEGFSRSQALRVLARIDRQNNTTGHEENIGAVQALLDSELIKSLPKIVIEGAPGQGKSTITQYLCQIQRMEFLGKSREFNQIPEAQRPRTARLPMRVDLRDYATWLNGGTPFSASNGVSGTANNPPALESFLAAQISAFSGGQQFSVDDLLFLAKRSALLIVLDGFDEVADIATRNKLVREITDASARLDANTLSSQMIVTSRPAAFANSAGFPREEWQYIQLLPLSKSDIDTYTEKWLAGAQADERDKSIIRAVLSQKLEYPHVRELARNPMQLAILLALVSTQGASLPDKRTALYDRYVDIFFNREAEKSNVVRDNRELLIHIHRYLAWHLQIRAESDSSAGNISSEQLRIVLRGYLGGQGHDTALVDELFTGMVERVVALVSRVQGTYEFEVQPLREYFAARYIYDTAPYIPPGIARSGSIMDRFEALARNGYWLNVTRFYCGCYSTGELSSLVDSIIEIGEKKEYSGTSYINSLGRSLLADYVFSQHPRSVDRLSEYLFDKSHFHRVLASAYFDPGSSFVSLPDGCGRSKLVDAAVSALREATQTDVSQAAARIIRQNTDPKERNVIWSRIRQDLSPDRRLMVSGSLGVLGGLEANDIRDMIDEARLVDMWYCIYAGRSDVFVTRGNLWSKYIELALDQPADIFHVNQELHDQKSQVLMSVVVVLASVICLCSISSYKKGGSGRTFFEYLGMPLMPSLSLPPEIIDRLADDESARYVDPKVLTACQRLLRSRVLEGEEFFTSAALFIEALVDAYGWRVQLVDAAIGAARFYSRRRWASATLGVLAEFCEFKANKNNADWWKSRLSNYVPGLCRFAVARAYLKSASSEVLRRTIREYSDFVDLIDEDTFSILLSGDGALMPASGSGRRQLFALDDFRVGEMGIGARAAALIVGYVGVKDRALLYEHSLGKYQGDNVSILTQIANVVLEQAHRVPGKLAGAIIASESCYARGATPLPFFLLSSFSPTSAEAEGIVATPFKYPLLLVAAAQRFLTLRAGKRVMLVGKVADRDRWFDEPS